MEIKVWPNGAKLPRKHHTEKIEFRTSIFGIMHTTINNMLPQLQNQHETIQQRGRFGRVYKEKYCTENFQPEKTC